MIGRRLIGRYFVGSVRSPEFLNAGTTEAHFQQSGNIDSLMHLLNSLDSIGESSGDNCFNTMAGI